MASRWSDRIGSVLSMCMQACSTVFGRRTHAHSVGVRFCPLANCRHEYSMNMHTLVHSFCILRMCTSITLDAVPKISMQSLGIPLSAHTSWKIENCSCVALRWYSDPNCDVHWNELMRFIRMCPALCMLLRQKKPEWKRSWKRKKAGEDEIERITISEFKTNHVTFRRAKWVTWHYAWKFIIIAI